MSHSKIHVASYDSGNKIIKITPAESFDPEQDAQLLYQTIFNLTKIKQIRILFDLINIAYPPNSFIGFMIEISSLLHRQGGELLIVNLSETAKMNIISFNPMSFLQIFQKEEDIKQTVLATTDQKRTDSSVPEVQAVGNTTNGQNDFSIKDILSTSPENQDMKFENNHPANFDFSDLAEEKTEPINETKTERIVVHSKEDQLYKLTDFVGIHAEHAGFDHTEVSRIKISVYEAAHNVIEHAYEFDTNKYIELQIKYDRQKFTIKLMDKGKSFEYDPNKDYDAIEAAEERKTGGFGLHIIRRSMDDVQYESNPVWGNRLTMIKAIP